MIGEYRVVQQEEVRDSWGRDNPPLFNEQPRASDEVWIGPWSIAYHARFIWQERKSCAVANHNGVAR